MLPALFALHLTALASVDPPEVYHGRVNTEVHAPRIEAEIVVDGVLDEAAWSDAALLTGFSQYRPVDGLPAADSTEVLVWYASDALYVGVRAFEPHDVVNATLADRDAIFGDDHVQLLLDTFDDQRRALVFAVNPLGVQADGVRNEAEQASGGYFDAEAAERGRLDLNPDFVFESRGRVTDDGYVVELRIPFESIRFQDKDVQTWGIQVIREVQHAGQTQTWTPVRRGATSFLGQAGTLVGLEGLRRGLVLDVAPVLTQQVTGARGPDGWEYSDGGTEAGLDLRWGVTPNLTANATINPDFSQVEADVAQVQFDPRQALSFPEKRPFFLEGSEHFSVPGGIIYTRSIVDPVGAAKLTGKVGGFSVAALSAVDDRDLSATGEDDPVITILRVRRDLGEASSWGAVYTDRIEGSGYNHVGALDGRFILGDYTVDLQGGASVTRSPSGDPFTGWLWNAAVERSGRRWGWRGYLRGWDDDFVPGTGFISRKGVYGGFVPRITFFGDPGGALESWSTAIDFNGWWRYGRFDGGTRPDEAKAHFNNSFAFRGGWRAGLTFIVENFLYPDYLYESYWVERRDDAGVPVDTVPFVGQSSINNFDVGLTIATPEFPRFSASGFFLVGRDENFPEWSQGYLVWIESQLDWRPTDRIRVTPRYLETRIIRPDDKSVVQLTRIPRVRFEYQVARPFFVRAVGQYVAFEQDDLRDDAGTGDPILVRASDGTFSPAVARSSNRFSFDLLLSYRPTPGTVVFAGYGSTLGEDEPFRFRGLERDADGFFLKVSYLFRM